MTQPRIALPPELRFRPFSVSEATEILGRNRLRGRDLAQPFWGVRAPAPGPASVRDLARARAARLGPHMFYSHVTAAQLWGIPLPWHLEIQRTLDVAVPFGRAFPVGKGVRGHRLQIGQTDVVSLGGLAVTSLARTWCDLAAVLSDEALLAAGDFLLWRRRPYWLRLTADDLTAAIERFAGRRGLPLLHAILPELTDRADSPPESFIRLRIVRSRLPAVSANPEVRDEHGKFVGMPDLAFLEFRVALDYEGDGHRVDPVQWEKDIARQTRFEDAGWRYLRAGKADLHNTPELLVKLERRLRSQGWAGPDA
ncbi:hypothetical protein [Salinibacterium sp. ZJ450]|uniref:hypothetical protein n=1 Tax=Salinibacterium sp. ZJ450 TaxID=2708338 RepID=UPI0014213932|nr:hypothetical protein [Salinibacterium sp. ZJ450]